MFALLSLVQSPGLSSLWIHPAFSVRSMECFYHTMDIRLNVRITQPCSISRLILSLDSSCVFCPEHGMFLSYHGYKTQCSHHSASFNLQAYPLSGFILHFCPGFIKCSYYTMFFVLLKVFCIRKGRYKSRNSLVPLLYLPSQRRISLSYVSGL